MTAAMREAAVEEAALQEVAPILASSGMYRVLLSHTCLQECRQMYCCLAPMAQNNPMDQCSY